MARLLAINVGLPRNVSWRGTTVHTAVWKSAVSGPCLARRLNLEGDGQGDLAGHGGEHRAVMVYQIESYRYWERQLQRDDFVYGQFGENFTIEGLPDDEVCIGDRYRIGGALFEVTQPRVTCYRVGLRMNEPRMAALLGSHRRPGFYLRVLTEGPVEAGDEIVKVGAGPEGMTVAEVDGLLYLPGHSKPDVARALRIPALSPGWKSSFQALLDATDGAAGNPGLTTAAESPPPAWSGFRPLEVTCTVPESTSVLSLVLAAPEGGALPAALPGQFLTLKLDAEPGNPPLIRSYSLSGQPGSPTYRISVKQEPRGLASSYLRTRIQPGAVIDVAAPRGSFTLRQAAAPVLLVSAGVGATPVLAMLHALATERSPRVVWWLHSARNGAEHPFAEEVRGLLAELPNARIQVCYSSPQPTDRPGIEYDRAGRLTGAVLRGLALPTGADAYICGPPSFMQDISAALVELGMPAARIRTELFGAAPPLTPGVTAAAAEAPHQPPGPPGRGPSVAFVRSGLTATWDARYANLLELAEACSMPTRWSCRTGVCHTCETALLQGTVAYSPEPVEPPAGGNALICCSQPRGDLVLDL